MEWIHCNKCCAQPSSRDNDFVMTSCGHIFCKKCESRENVDHCIVCQANCKTQPLKRTMKPEIRMYFEDIGGRLNNLSEEINSLCRIYRFQRNHAVSLNKKRSRIVENCKNLKVENDLLRKKLLESQKKIHFFEREKKQFSTATPKANIVQPHPRHSAIFLNNPRTPVQDVYNNSHAAFMSSQPHLRSVSQYRNNTQQTPIYNPSIGSASSSGFANQFHRQAASSGFARPRESPVITNVTQKGPTPLYSAIRGMQLHELKRSRK